MLTAATLDDPRRFHRVNCPDPSRFTAAEIEAMRRSSETLIASIGQYLADRNVRVEAWVVPTLAAAGLSVADAGACRLVMQEVERLPGRWVDLITLEHNGKPIGDPLRLVVEFVADAVARP